MVVRYKAPFLERDRSPTLAGVMMYTKLGSSGTAVSKIALGTMYFGDETPQDEAFAILDAFVEAGGNLIDTADVYAAGRSEEVIGRWFASRPNDITDRVVLATKGRTTNGPDVTIPVYRGGICTARSTRRFPGSRSKRSISINCTHPTC